MLTQSEGTTDTPMHLNEDMSIHVRFLALNQVPSSQTCIARYYIGTEFICPLNAVSRISFQSHDLLVSQSNRSYAI